jgi:hypothetical protein
VFFKRLVIHWLICCYSVGVLCVWGHTVEQAIEIAAAIRLIMWPNEWILELWGNLLEIEGIPEKVEQCKNIEAEKGLFIPDSK